MKKLMFLFVVLTAVLLGQQGFAADTNAVMSDLHALVAQINAKIMKGDTLESDYSDELKQFDALYAKYKNLKTEDVAQILKVKAGLYLQVINAPNGDAEKAYAIYEQIKRDLPDTATGQKVDQILDYLKKPVEMERIRNTLVVGAKFPDLGVNDLDGKPISLTNHTGKVVLVDFWATWCPPCVAEVPNVVKIYSQYHDKGFDIIGVSLDEDRSALDNFIKEKNMTWQQYFDGKRWDNKLVGQYGVESAPTTYLLDGQGKIIGMNLRGADLEAAVAKALQKN